MVLAKGFASDVSQHHFAANPAATATCLAGGVVAGAGTAVFRPPVDVRVVEAGDGKPSMQPRSSTGERATSPRRVLDRRWFR